MHFRKTFLIIVVLFNVDLALCSEFIVFTRANNSTNNIQIPPGETWRLVNWYAEGGAEVGLNPVGPYFRFENSDELFGTNELLLSASYPYQMFDGGLNLHLHSLIAGPSLIEAGSTTLNTNAKYYLVFEKLGASENSADAVPSTSVVIPAATSGDVDVKLEQSADNVTWTECLPGTYNSSTVKRFFRLRAVEK